MKQLYLFALIFLLVNNALIAKKVKFAVDMTGYEVSSLGVHIGGDFQTAAGFAGGDWESHTTKLTQEGTTNIYSIVVDIPAFKKYEYKYINGNEWYQVEFVPLESRVLYQFSDNRWLYIDSLRNDTTFIGAVKYEGNAPADKKLLRFQVDLPSTLQADAAGVHIAGNWQGWKPEEITMYSFDGEVYEYIAYVDSTSVLEYKYVNGSTTNKYEIIEGACTQNGSRFHNMIDHLILPKVCFAACEACKITATKDINTLDSNIYPNPFSESLNLELGETTIAFDLTISDLVGRIIMQKTQNIGNRLTIDNFNFPQGIYLLTITNQNKQKSNHKLYKR